MRCHPHPFFKNALIKNKQSVLDASEPIPQGTGWILTACCFSFILPGALVFGFPGVMGDYWQTSFQVSRAAVGQILFYVLVTAGFMMFVTGSLQEKIGHGRVIAAGTVLCAAGTFLLGYAENMKWVYLWAVLIGAASALVYLPALTVAQIWHPGRRGFVSGLVSMFFGISGAFMAPVFTLMFHAVGYQKMTLILSGASLALGLGAACFIRAPSVPLSDTAAPDLSEGIAIALGRSIRTKSFWNLWLTYAFVGAGGISMVPFSTQFGLAKGLTGTEAVLILMSFNLTNGLSRLLSGMLSDVIGRKAVMCSAFASAGAAYLLFPYVTGIPAWSVLAAMIGFAFGTLFAVSAPFIADCFGMAHFGSIFGLIFTGYGFFSGALGPWLGGYILDITQGDFQRVFIYLGGLMLISALLVLITTPRKE
jgi:OFA family oxalate/formate antiporter-like MFS transporter